MARPQRKRLLLVKGSFENFGGGERDLINNLSAWSKFFDISVATLHPNEELMEKLWYTKEAYGDNSGYNEDSESSDSSDEFEPDIEEVDLSED